MGAAVDGVNMRPFPVDSGVFRGGFRAFFALSS
jgi:hypothetical protein